MGGKKNQGKVPGAKFLEISNIFLKNQSSLKRFIGRFVQQPQDIEDIVHETFLRTYMAEINTRIKSPRAFLYKTARNLALKHLDKCSYRLVDHIEDLSTLEVLMDEISTETRVQSQEQFYIFCRAVSNLPLQCRKAFILRKIYGYSHKEIAKELEISISTVEKHLAHGLLKCHEYMCRQGLGYNQPDPVQGDNNDEDVG